MKKFFTTLLLMFAVMGTYAHDVEIDGIFYNLFSTAKEAVVTYKGTSYYDYSDRYSNSVTIPSTITFGDVTYSVTGIGNSAFQFCNSLTSVTIPNTVKIIGGDAFHFCSGLTSVTIGNSVASIGDWAFNGCNNLTSLNVDADNPYYCSEENVIYTKDKSTLVYCIMTKAGEFVIPNSVKNIGDSAFWGNSHINSVIIPNSVTSIGFWAFVNCSGLTSVTIGNSVTKISERAFSGCENLETVTCLAGKVPSTSKYAFINSYVNAATLIVPESSLQAYKTTAPWSEFGTFKTVEGGDVPSTPRCATPSIAYENGKLYYVTATPGATVVSNVVVEDAKTSYDACVPLTATYNITAYATKSGYDDSDAATATLVWATATFTPGETTNAKEMTIDALPLLITQEDGMVTISGIADGATVTAYGTNGTTVASAKAIGNAALLNLSDLQGKVAVLNVNGKSAKVAIK